jgi:hypothetical protein
MPEIAVTEDHYTTIVEDYIRPTGQACDIGSVAQASSR